MSKIGKLRQRIAIIRKADDNDKPFSRKELEKEKKSYEESIKRKRRSPTKSELTNRNVRLDQTTDYFNKSKKKFDEEHAGASYVTDRRRESDAIEREFINRNRKVDPKKHKGGTLMRKKLKQRIAQVRLAYASPPKDVINAFRNKETLKMHAKKKGGGELSFQTDGKTLYQLSPDPPQRRYEIATWVDDGLEWSYENHPTPSTSQAGRMLGINTFTKDGKTFVDGKEVNPYSYDRTFVPNEHLQEGTVKVNPRAHVKKYKDYTPEEKQKIKDQDVFRQKANKQWKETKHLGGHIITDPDTGEIYDQAKIQPHEQKEINRILGYEKELPRESFVKDFHHANPVSKKSGPTGGIFDRVSPSGSVPLGKRGHAEAHDPAGTIPPSFRKRILKARLKIARIRMAAAPGISMNPQHGRTIADAFDTMQHTPNSPKVKASYGAFINETNDQARALQKSGVKFEAGKQGGYESHNDMHSDIEKNKHLFYRISDKDYKGFEDNPMFKLTNIKNSAGLRMRANDVFRAVHDINGHNLAGRSTFTPSGEHKAFLQHRKMYTPLASKALFTETAAQANWTNFSKKHGARNQMLQKTKKTGYATDSAGITFPQQKAGLLPDNIIGGNWHQRLGKQRNISRINIAQKSVMNLRETRVSDIRRTWKKQEANIKKYPDGFTILDDDVLDLNQPAHLQKILDKYPGKGNVYIVSSLGGGNKPVTSIDSPEVDKGFDEWKQRNFTPQAGGYEGGVEMNALFRAEDNEQAKVFTKDFDQKAYTEVRPNGTFGFFDRNGNPV